MFFSQKSPLKTISNSPVKKQSGLDIGPSRVPAGSQWTSNTKSPRTRQRVRQEMQQSSGIDSGEQSECKVS